MATATDLSASGLPPEVEQLRSVLIEGETLLAFALQRRIFALTHRREVIAATSGRFLALTRGFFGGFDLVDLRWQDLRDAKVRVGVIGADLSLTASLMSDLATGGSGTRTLLYRGFRKDQTEQIYRIAQGQEQSWREKRRIRELDEMRAKSGGVQIGGMGLAPGAAPGAPSGDVVARLQQAKQMLDAKLITDAEYEAIKARVINTV